ncbi:MAG: hypothetical protein RBQ91_05565 [Acholeplasma sp.]|nr:hypothetical protein [Acholeplasma sp.]
MKQYSINQVENNQISVNEYLRQKAVLLNPYRFKKASGLRMVFMKNQYLFLSPKIPFWILKGLKRFLKRFENNQFLELSDKSLKDVINLLSALGKNNLILEVESAKQQFRFEIWGA